MRLTAPGPGQAGPPGLELADPATYAEADPHAAWQWFRAHAPVSWQRAGDLGYWSVTRYADVRHVLRDHETFTSERGTLLSLLGQPDPASGKQLAATDPPRHTRMRAPLHRELDADAVRRHEPMVRAHVIRVLSDVDGACDLAAVMGQLPIAVLGTLMGLPSADWGRLTELAMMAVAPDDPAWRLPRGPGATLQRAHRELFAYFTDRLRERQRRPGPDLVSTLLSMEFDGERMDPPTVLSNCYSLLLGALVTVPNVPTAALLALADLGRYAATSSGGAPVERLVEEALRWSSPANHFLRHTTRDTVLHGVRLAAGDPVVVWLGSANRDEAVFDEPYVFRADRTPNRHLALGGGAHYCIGYALARLMLTAVFEEFFARVADLAPAGPISHVRSSFVAGYRHVPVTVALRQPDPTGARR